MKAKTLMGMIACAGACVSLSAFGNTTNGWFGVTVGTGITPVNCATNGVAVTVANNKIVLDNDKSSPLTITPNASFEGTNRNDGVYVIQATAALTPCSKSDLDSNITEGAKAGFAVGIDNNVTNYYGYASEGWKPYNGVSVVAEGNDTTFKIVLNYRDRTVQFYAGPDAATYLGKATFAGSTSAPIGIDAFGSGSISSITSGYEVAVAEYNNIKYGSVAEALKVAGPGNENSVAVVNESGVTQSTVPAANGLQKWECAALGIAEDKQVGLDKSVKQNEGKITLAVQGIKVADGLQVKYVVKEDDTALEGEFDADNIQIPMGNSAGQHTYKIVPTITAK